MKAARPTVFSQFETSVFVHSAGFVRFSIVTQICSTSKCYKYAALTNNIIDNIIHLTTKLELVTNKTTNLASDSITAFLISSVLNSARILSNLFILNLNIPTKSVCHHQPIKHPQPILHRNSCFQFLPSYNHNIISPIFFLLFFFHVLSSLCIWTFSVTLPIFLSKCSPTILQHGVSLSRFI